MNHEPLKGKTKNKFTNIANKQIKDNYHYDDDILAAVELRRNRIEKVIQTLHDMQTGFKIITPSQKDKLWHTDYESGFREAKNKSLHEVEELIQTLGHDFEDVMK